MDKIRPVPSVIITFICLALIGSRVAAPAAEPPKGNATVPPDHAKQMAAGLELFKQSVGTTLKEHCVRCHGGEKTKSDFDLTTRETLLKGGAEGPDVIAGNARESKLMKLLRHGEEPHMPEKKPKLPDEAIAQIAAWIDAGAPYAQPLVAGKQSKDRSIVTEQDRQFWSFQPLRPATPPALRDSKYAANNPIDQFILAKLDEKEIKPSPPANRRKLIRRVYLDLIGLPPPPREIHAFLSDQSRDAYDKLIDRLLASPHYGERWGRHWLDLARFGESHGYEQDYDRTNAYHYRDFVIQALNDDLPYDRFVQWQIAGDEFAPDSLLAWKATGFLAAGTHATQITANQAEKERYDELDDLAATIGTSMLGLTIGCARCHDHKFDPIPTADYYRLISTFTTTVRSDYDLPIDPAKYRLEKEHFDREHAPLVAALEQFEKDDLSGRFAAWEKTGARPALPKWFVLDEATAKSKGGATLTKQADGSFLASGDNPDFDTYAFTVPAPLAGITAIKVEALADPSMKKGGPGRADNGNFALSDFRLAVTPLGSTNKVEAKFAKASATFEQKGLPVAAAIDEDKKSAWAVDPQFGTNHAAVFELAAPLTNAPGSTLTFTLKFDTNNKHGIGRPRLSVTTVSSPGFDGDSGSMLVAEAARFLDVPAAQRTDAERKTLLKWYRTQDTEWRKLNERVIGHAAKEPNPEKVKVLVSSEGLPAVRLHTQGPDFYETTWMLKRGDLAQKQSEANQGFLQVLMRASEQENHWKVTPPKDARTPFRRATLAHWITDVDNGAGALLARVIVNRLWQHHFGQGLVATPSDFGSTGARPTHPELLDWLAGELIRNGWRLKPVHKLIMTSATYRQRSDGVTETWSNGRHRTALHSLTPSLPQSTDPDNHLLWHFPRQRLEAEVIRDCILAVSGRLDLRMFGPGSLDEGMTRRSIYFRIKRSKLIPMMVQFDAPDSLQSLGRRVNTTVAPQALLMMNNPHVRASAVEFARRLKPKAEKSLASAVESAYVRALARSPTTSELADAVDFLKQQSSTYGGKEGLELALADFCQAVLGLNEFIYVP
jgi:mono/diheme cytochrome c family protein